MDEFAGKLLKYFGARIHSGTDQPLDTTVKILKPEEKFTKTTAPERLMM